MPLKEQKYKQNQAILKVFGCGEHKKIKLVQMATLKTAGIEDGKPSRRCEVNTEKLEDNLSRTKSKIFELAFCNPWEYFFTATLNPQNYDRTNLEDFHRDLTQWLRNYNKKYKISIKYLLIPELHSDGKSWHMHGFLMGLPADHLHQFTLGDIMGKKLAEKVKRGDTVYNWLPYLQKFGFCDLEPVRNPEACAKYITKYISKELAHSVTQLNAHQYYRSKGLAGAVTIAKGYSDFGNLPVPSYVGDYAVVWWLEYSPELLAQLSEKIIP